MITPLPDRAAHLLQKAELLKRKASNAALTAHLYSRQAKQVAEEAAAIVAKERLGMEIGDLIAWKDTVGFRGRSIGVHGPIISFELVGTDLWAKVNPLRADRTPGLKVVTCYDLTKASVERKAGP